MKAKIEDIGTDGRGIAKHEGKVIFVKDAVPGDEVTIRLMGKRRKKWNGEIEELLTPSPDRTEPVCSHFGLCGGCKWQHLDYTAQLKYKQQWVHEALTRIGGLELPDMQPIVGADEIYTYRNKMEYSFSAKRWLTKGEIDSGKVFEQQGALGFHVPRVFEKVVHIDNCHLQPEPGNAIRNFIHAYALEHAIPYYDAKAHTGILRNLLIRITTTGELMVMVLMTEAHDGLMQALAAEFPQTTCLGYIPNTKLNDSYHDLTPVVTYGKPYITEKLGRYQFQISPKSFFQTNTQQAECLYQLVYELMPDNTPLLYDLYCGAGSIGIYVSDKVDKIVGVEYVEDAVFNARENVALNQLSGFDFTAGDLAKVLTPEFVKQHGQPDLVITDPPRAGMDPKVVKALLQLAPETIIYVSCNPGTQARDLALMAEQYRIDYVQPVDMFPHTTHVENVVRMRRRG